jgi:hypothetical protein
MPNDATYSEEEFTYVHEDGSIMKSERRVFALTTHDEKAFIDAFEKMIVTVDEEEHVIASVRTENAYTLSSEKLSRIRGIGIPSAKLTLEATTKKGVITVSYPSVERRWPTEDRPLRYWRLDHQVYHDTLKSRIKYVRGNTCSEIYATDFGWSRTFPMKKESDVHETLDLFLSHYGIPEALVSDGAKAYTGGLFKKEAREAGIFCKLTDPYSPWKNRAKGAIREVKRLAGRWMVRTRSPHRLWDHCIELSC